ncbi:MAG: hypothetical protein K6A81_11790 [Clostridiales bacterium]|nr:hypothetical protein [Clostridiales bacterium]
MEGRIAEVPLDPGDLTVGEDIDLVGGREMTRGYVLQTVLSDERPDFSQNLTKYQTKGRFVRQPARKQTKSGQVSDKRTICQITGQKTNKIWPSIRQKDDLSDIRPENKQNLANHQTKGRYVRYPARKQTKSGQPSDKRTICQITGQKTNKIWPSIRQKDDMSDNRSEIKQNLAKYQTRQKRTKKEKGLSHLRQLFLVII